MALTALILASIAILLSVATFVTLLLLLGGKDDRFVTWRNLRGMVDQIERIAKGLSDLYRYVERVDEATGANGHKVLARRVPGNHPKA